MKNTHRSSGFISIKLIIALIIGLFTTVSYFFKRDVNPVTKEVQRVSITPEQEIALGLQAVPKLSEQHGGFSKDPQATSRVDRVGEKIVSQSIAKKAPYKFDFHLLDDKNTVNAFALPGGQVFITEALLSKLNTEGQLAGVLAHEIAHVVGRHGAEHLAKQQLTQGLTGAAIIATYDPTDPRSRGTAMVALAVGQLVNMKFGRNDEIESDKMGVEFMADAQYDPRSLKNVMEVLRKASGSQVEFFSTHPNPDNRLEKIDAAIAEKFPSGVPAGLVP